MMWKALAIGELRQLTRDLPVDLFLKLAGENYCHVFSRATGLDYQRLHSYRQKGVTELYYRIEDDELVSRYRREKRMDALLQNASVQPEQKAGILLNLTEQTVAEVFSSLPLSEEAAQSSRGLVTHLVDLMSQQPQSLAALLRLVSHGKYLYYHSVAVSIFSGLLAKVSGKYSDEDARLIAWGGFLHDIGMSRQEDEWTCDPLIELDARQMERIESHCRLGMESIAEVGAMPKEVRFMVYQHHESSTPGARSSAATPIAKPSRPRRRSRGSNQKSFRAGLTLRRWPGSGPHFFRVPLDQCEAGLGGLPAPPWEPLSKFLRSSRSILTYFSGFRFLESTR
jgi:putative nucleotidyltransferase with HDIG domain